MPHRTALVLLLLFFFHSAIAQLSISGRVVNDQTGLPIAGASVYFNNTSIGISSDSAGGFSFHNLSLVNTELIVSSVGYEILAVKLTTAKSNGIRLLCRLSAKEQQLKDVLALTDARRKKWLAMFRENFLGLSQEADESEILNTDNIYFASGETRTGFKAYADSPLVIINNMLGYRIYFQLIEFSIDDSSGRSYFYGYTRYEELGNKKKWIKHRKDVYYGSTLHFYRSLIADRLEEEGYDIFTFNNVVRGPAKQPVSDPILVNPSQIIARDSSGTGYFRITIPGSLLVRYHRNPPSKSYLTKKLHLAEKMRLGFLAYISLNAPYFLIDENGIPENPLLITYTGYWAYERAANLLPFDYQP